jgi:hypothetical protein
MTFNSIIKNYSNAIVNGIFLQVGTLLISKNILIPWCGIDVVASKIILFCIFDNFEYAIFHLENECPTPHVSR